MGIENNSARNFKSLQEMQKNAKSLKRNDEACNGILIAPSKLPRISVSSDPPRCDFLDYLELYVGFGPNFCGADGKPTKEQP